MICIKICRIHRQMKNIGEITVKNAKSRAVLTISPILIAQSLALMSLSLMSLALTNLARIKTGL
ncbi:Uncharacterised protein [Plesiomonas shigelloides]|nr:Uncharacterised protein [Plesiomonas shigelloides]